MVDGTKEDHYCFGSDPCLCLFQMVGVRCIVSIRPNLVGNTPSSITSASRQQNYARDTGITALPPVAPGLQVLITLTLVLFCPQDVDLGDL